MRSRPSIAHETELQTELEGERANATELRRVLAQQAEALASIKRRKAVRAVLALDRHTRPVRTALSAWTRRLRSWRDRAGLLPGALRSNPHMPLRRAIVTAAVERIEPPRAQTRRRSIDVVSETAPASAASGAAVTSGELLCFLPPTSEPLEERWLDRLAEAIDGDVVAAAPLLLHPERPMHRATAHDLRVRELGLDLIATADGIPTTRAREAGTSPVPNRLPVEVFAASGACLLVDRCAYEAAGGFRPLDDLDAAAVDLCSRLRAKGGRIVAVPESVVVDHRPVRSVRELSTRIDPSGRAWREVIEREGPALRRQAWNGASQASLSIALTVAAPSRKMAPRWGDWHLAEAFARSLRNLGHSVRVQSADRADDPAGRCCDVHVVLRGVQPVSRTPGQRHVVWVISHPEAIETDECDEADLVLVASPRLATHLRSRTATPVEILLQATDHERFRPSPPDPRFAHPVAVVAKARDVLRRAVADALEAGLRPAIYGSGWEGLVDPSLVVADYVPNEVLPVVYSSIGVLLVDHWDTMRTWGIVSNRVFDALSCGTPVVTDSLPEVRELFGDAVPVYEDSDGLRLLVEAALRDPTAARQRAATGRERVLAAHTFDHRARTFLEALARHGLDALPDSSRSAARR
jgi:O-antigen biosynthesis protein